MIGFNKEMEVDIFFYWSLLIFLLMGFQRNRLHFSYPKPHIYLLLKKNYYHLPVARTSLYLTQNKVRSHRCKWYTVGFLEKIIVRS